MSGLSLEEFTKHFCTKTGSPVWEKLEAAWRSCAAGKKLKSNQNNPVTPTWQFAHGHRENAVCSADKLKNIAAVCENYSSNQKCSLQIHICLMVYWLYIKESPIYLIHFIYLFIYFNNFNFVSNVIIFLTVEYIF